MSLLRDVVAELVGMFLADLKLSGAILSLIALVALLVRFLGADAYVVGGALLIGCLAIIAVVTAIESRRR